MGALPEDVVVEDLTTTDWDQMVRDLTGTVDVDLELQGCSCGNVSCCEPTGSAGGNCTIHGG